MPDKMIENEPALAHSRLCSKVSLSAPSRKASLATGGFMVSHSSPALDASVLVLNKLFMAVHIISVRRAFCLLCKDQAEVISHEDGQFTSYSFDSWRDLSAYRASHFRAEDE